MSRTHVPGRGPAAGARRAAGGGAGGSWCPRGPRAGGARIALAGRRGRRRQPEPHGAGPGAEGGGRARGAAPPRPPPEPWAQAAQRKAAAAAGGAERAGGRWWRRTAGAAGGRARAGGRAAHVTQTRAPHRAAGRGRGGGGGARPPAGPAPSAHPPPPPAAAGERGCTAQGAGLPGCRHQSPEGGAGAGGAGPVGGSQTRALRITLLHAFWGVGRPIRGHPAGPIQGELSKVSRSGARGHDPGALGRPGWWLQLLPLPLLLQESGSVGPAGRAPGWSGLGSWEVVPAQGREGRKELGQTWPGPECRCRWL